MVATPLQELGRSAIDKKGWLVAHRYLLARRFCQLAILALFLLGPVSLRAWGEVWILKGNLSNSSLLETVPLLDPFVFLQMLAAGAVGIGGTALVGVLIVSLFYALVGGRVFCSWVCPLNMVTDAARWSRRKLQLKGGGRLKPHTRLFMLAAVLVVSLVTGRLSYELINPVSVLHRGIIFGFGLGWAIVLAVFLFDLLFVKDGWCGHLCPQGALYGLIGRFALLRVQAKKRKACDDCMECYEVCPENHVIPPALKGAHGEGPVILSADCTNCGRCIDICDEQVFRFGARH